MTDNIAPIETEDSLDTSQTRTIEILENNGLGEYIKEAESQYGLTSFDQLSELPIPVSLIPTTKITLKIEEKVQEYFDTLSSAIKDPTTAYEIPFGAVGRITSDENSEEVMELNRLTFLYPNFDSLEQTTVYYNSDKLGLLVDNIIRSAGENTLVIGHTHPLTTQEVQEKLLTTRMDRDLKDRYEIREPGLNLSIQDIYQLVDVQNQLKKDTRLVLGVIMYNDERVWVQIRDGKLVRLVEE